MDEGGAIGADGGGLAIVRGGLEEDLVEEGEGAGRGWGVMLLLGGGGLLFEEGGGVDGVVGEGEGVGEVWGGWVLAGDAEVAGERVLALGGVFLLDLFGARYHAALADDEVGFFEVRIFLGENVSALL